MWTKYIKVVLVILTLVISKQLQAADTAIVIKDKAVVYADSELVSPVGYLRAGVRILVTEKNYSKDTVKGMAYKGRIVYISLTDIDIIGSGSLSDRYHFERFIDTANKY